MEILQFRDSVKEILTEMTPVKELIIEKISTIIKRAVPHSEVKVYGSHATKLCLPWSDIDLVIITQNRSSDGIYMNYPRSVLGQISSELRNEKENKWVSHVNYHDNATVPVVKVNCHVKDLINHSNNHMLLSPSDYITQMTDHHNGLECVGVVQDYLKENEIIEPIMFVLKQLLKASNLNNPYSGGLSSYALFLMVVSFLQSHE
jgi:non-canonical poly(A) RNA polymerase PAPD5/7